VIRLVHLQKARPVLVDDAPEARGLFYRKDDIRPREDLLQPGNVLGQPPKGFLLCL
jgi:hypothetical protein